MNMEKDNFRIQIIRQSNGDSFFSISWVEMTEEEALGVCSDILYYLVQKPEKKKK